MADKKPPQWNELVKRGYQPTTDGYQPSEQLPENHGTQNVIPPLPKGGSGQSQGSSGSDDGTSDK